MQNLNIKDWDEQDRPREKLLSKGNLALSDAELIAILIGSGNSTLTAVDLAKLILKTVDNDLNKLAQLKVQDLMRFNGIGEAKAISIIAAIELGRRRNAHISPLPAKIRVSSHLYDFIMPFLRDLPHEELWLISLNNASEIIKHDRLAMGGVVGVAFDIKLLLKTALQNKATAVALVHNHPSGQAFPSKQDIEVTAKIKLACQSIDLFFVDHLIVTDNNGYYSFSDQDVEE